MISSGRTTRAAEQLSLHYAGRGVVSRQLAFDCENATPADKLQALLDESQNEVIVLRLDIPFVTIDAYDAICEMSARTG